MYINDDWLIIRPDGTIDYGYRGDDPWVGYYFLDPWRTYDFVPNLFI